MIKLIKRLISFILIIVIAITGLFIYKGYTLYEEAINEFSIAEKIEQIKNRK